MSYENTTFLSANGKGVVFFVSKTLLKQKVGEGQYRQDNRVYVMIFILSDLQSWHPAETDGLEAVGGSLGFRICSRRKDGFL